MQEISVIIVGRIREYNVRVGKILSREGLIVHLRDMDCFDRIDELMAMRPNVVIVNEIFPERNMMRILDICGGLSDMFFIFPSAYRNQWLESCIADMGSGLFLLRPVDFRGLAEVIRMLINNRGY